ncbi:MULTISPECIES: PspC domain-containing protein [unclassified Enterococcus]|jgi:phage shock protein C|uniref:PspC domain-containing protein n=1 Tax=unclassified Enterococcus TaxID=2608891 RepID=UPI0006B88066|nr:MULTISPECIES: PspC domain-containing protein [unclassified Enterococcus]KPG72986.1 PspC family transcriptional regulator [Enterococcus sp. RIT-PI-f]HCE11616.1 PspC domain-containing protein [Enterococcus sp.]
MNKKLTKSTNNVVITGTLGGLAEYLGIDPTIVRVIYVFLSLVTAAFPGITLYVILAILIPSGRKSTNGYGHDNQYYQKNNDKEKSRPRKQAEKVEDEDWSDF